MVPPSFQRITASGRTSPRLSTVTGACQEGQRATSASTAQTRLGGAPMRMLAVEVTGASSSMRDFLAYSSCRVLSEGLVQSGLVAMTAP